MMLSYPGHAVIDKGEGTVTISDNDALPSVSMSNASTTEGTAAEFLASVSPISGRDVTVYYNTAPGSALSDGESRVDTFTYAVKADEGIEQTVSVMVTVQGVNDAPMGSAFDDLLIQGTDTTQVDFDLRGYFTDAEDSFDDLTFVAVEDSAATLVQEAYVCMDRGSEQYGVVTLLLNSGGQTVGDTEVVEIKATDTGGANSGNVPLAVEVVDVNNAPALPGSVYQDRYVAPGEPVQFWATAEGDGDKYSDEASLEYFIAGGVPAAATIDENTGWFHWVAPSQAGEHEVMIGAREVRSDGLPGLMTVGSFVITVGAGNQPPQVTPIGSKFTWERDTLAFAVGATDPDGPSGSLKYDLGEGTPDGATIDAAGNFRWTPTSSQDGEHVISVLVTDTGTPPKTTEEQFTVTVGDVIEVPQVTDMGPLNNTGGDDDDPDVEKTVDVDLDADGTFRAIPTTVGQDGEVKGRYVFYNNSSFDGNNPGPNANDDNAIAPDSVPGQSWLRKEALIANEGANATYAGFHNVTSYDKGINGIMIDIYDVPDVEHLDAGDFQFRVGIDDTPDDWAVAPAPNSVSVRPGDGGNGSDIVTIIWNDGAIKNKWLQVRVLANDDTGLLHDDVFYFGNLVGETDARLDEAIVDSHDIDALNAATWPYDRGPDQRLDTPYDFNRDKVFNSADDAICRGNLGASLPLITAPPDYVGAESTSVQFIYDVERDLIPQIEDGTLGLLNGRGTFNGNQHEETYDPALTGHVFFDCMVEGAPAEEAADGARADRVRVEFALAGQFDKIGNRIRDGFTEVYKKVPEGGGDPWWEFVYAPSSVASGENEIWVRVVEEGFLGAQESVWTPFTFDMLDDPQPEIDTFYAVHGSIPPGGQMYNVSSPTVAGTVVHPDGELAGLAVEIGQYVPGANPEVESLGFVTTDATGAFEFAPIVLEDRYPADSHIELRARVLEEFPLTDAVWDTIPWEETLQMVLHRPDVVQLSLANDTGSDPDDGVTRDPTLVGTVVNDGSPAGLIVEFDHHGDQTIDGSVLTDPLGRFSYLPAGLSYTDPTTIEVKVKEWDPVVGLELQSAPASVDVMLVPARRLVVHSVVDATGHHDPTISGSIWEEGADVPLNFAVNATVEFDHDGDGLVDGRAECEPDGSFVYHPQDFPFGYNYQLWARVTQPDVARGVNVLSDWKGFGQLYFFGSGQLTVNGLGLSETTVDDPLAMPEITGQVDVQADRESRWVGIRGTKSTCPAPSRRTSPSSFGRTTICPRPSPPRRTRA